MASERWAGARNLALLLLAPASFAFAAWLDGAWPWRRPGSDLACGMRTATFELGMASSVEPRELERWFCVPALQADGPDAVRQLRVEPDSDVSISFLPIRHTTSGFWSISVLSASTFGTDAARCANSMLWRPGRPKVTLPLRAREERYVVVVSAPPGEEDGTYRLGVRCR